LSSSDHPKILLPYRSTDISLSARLYWPAISIADEKVQVTSLHSSKRSNEHRYANHMKKTLSLIISCPFNSFLARFHVSTLYTMGASCRQFDAEADAS
jgi:hypothetical protein